MVPSFYGFVSFKTCATANGWQEQDKLTDFPVFLRGRATTCFYALRDDQKSWYKALVKNLTEELCPKVDRKKFRAEFENRLASTGRGSRSFPLGVHTTSREGESISHQGQQNGSFGATIYAWTTSQDLPQTLGAQCNAMIRRCGFLCTTSFSTGTLNTLRANSTTRLSTDKNDPPETPDMSTPMVAVKALQV